MQLSHEDVKLICDAAVNIVGSLCFAATFIYFVKKQFG